MKIRVSHPDLAPDLVAALNETDCLAARIALDMVEVFVPWLTDDCDPRQAVAELRFFVRAWGAAHPELRATVLDPRVG
jgi:hypothetical protein